MPGHTDHAALTADASCGVTAWLLAGGEGRRVQGQDKGLLPWRGRPLAAWALDSLAQRQSTMPCAIGITANRHADAYQGLLASSRLVQFGAALAVPGGVLPDDADLPAQSGPLAGTLTALRHSHSEWVLILPCDTPCLPADLLSRLLTAALATSGRMQADIAVPFTAFDFAQATTEDTRHHWVCALIRKCLVDDLERAFKKGERKVGRWIQTQAWVGVCFHSVSGFQNINTTEALHGRD